MNIVHHYKNKRLIALWRGGRADFPYPHGGARDPVWCSETGSYLIGCKVPKVDQLDDGTIQMHIYFTSMSVVNMCLWAMDIQSVPVDSHYYAIQKRLPILGGNMYILRVGSYD